MSISARRLEVLTVYAMYGVSFLVYIIRSFYLVKFMVENAVAGYYIIAPKLLTVSFLRFQSNLCGELCVLSHVCEDRRGLNAQAQLGSVLDLQFLVVGGRMH